MYGTGQNIIVCGLIFSAYHVIRSMPWGNRLFGVGQGSARQGCEECLRNAVNFWSETAGHFFLPNPSAYECSNPHAICRNANRPRFKLMFIVRNKHRIIHKFAYFNVDGFLFLSCCVDTINIVKLSIQFLMVFSNYDSSLLKLRRYMNGTAPSLCILSLWINVFRVACWCIGLEVLIWTLMI